MYRAQARLSWSSEATTPSCAPAARIRDDPPVNGRSPGRITDFRSPAATRPRSPNRGSVEDCWSAELAACIVSFSTSTSRVLLNHAVRGGQSPASSSHWLFPVYTKLPPLRARPTR